MKCLQCGSEMTTRREDFDYSRCGLPVILLGLEVRHCAKCGERHPLIPMVEELHRVIANEVVRKKTRLVGAEVRFLRSWLGLSGRRFARRVGVTPETVSRWENDKQPIGDAEERLLRVRAAQKQFFVEYDIDALLDADYAEGAAPEPIRARATDHHWELAA